MLKALSLPGDHPLVITVVAGADADLLDGTLHVAVPADDHDEGMSYWLWLGLVLVLAILMALGFHYGRKARSSRTPGMGAVQ